MHYIYRNSAISQLLAVVFWYIKQIMITTYKICWWLLLNTGSVGSSVYVSNTTNISDGYMCFNDSNYTIDTVPALVNISCSTKAQYVIYYNEIRPGVKYPDYSYVYARNMLCEVEVYGKLLHLVYYALSYINVGNLFLLSKLTFLYFSDSSLCTCWLHFQKERYCL